MSDPSSQSIEIRKDQRSSEQKGTALPVPEEAVGAGISVLWDRDDEGTSHARSLSAEQTAREILRVAAPALRKQGAEEAERERDKWAVTAGIGMEIARAAQALLATVHPADGRSDPATVSRESITALQAALRAAEPEKGTPLDNARQQGADQERERAKRDHSVALLAELEEAPFSTNDGSDDPNRASLIDVLRRFLDGFEGGAAPDSPKTMPVFRYEASDLSYEPPDSAPDDWDGNLNDLIGDYIRLGDHQRRIEALKHEQMVKVTAEFMRAEKARDQERQRLAAKHNSGLPTALASLNEYPTLATLVAAALTVAEEDAAQSARQRLKEALKGDCSPPLDYCLGDETKERAWLRGAEAVLDRVNAALEADRG